MRDIKFRVWDHIEKQMVNPKDVNDFWARFVSSDCYELMQFTGMYDRDGVEIFESDIVEVICYFGTSGKHPKSTGPTITTLGVIEFKDGKFDYEEPKSQYNKRTEMGNATDWYRGYCDMREVKVVGNIHQHSELLK